MPIKKILMENIRVAFEKSRRVFRNVFTSGTFDKYRDDSGVYLKFLMVNAIGIVAGVCLLGYGILDIVRGVQPVGWIITGIGVMVLVNFLFLRATKNYIFASWVATLILTFGFMFLLSTGGRGNTGPLWIYTLPGVAMILLGIKAGSWLFSGFILYAGFVLFLPDSPLLFTDYPHDFVIRFIPTIITVLIMVYIFEALRRLSHKSILEKNLELEDSLTWMKEAEGALSKSEENFRNMAKLLPEVIFESDQQGKLTYVNNIAFEKFGYSEEDYSRGITALQVIAPDDRERAGENIKRIMSGEKFGGNEYKALRKDGSEFFALIYSSPIMSNNIPTGLRGIIIDMTARKKIEEELRQKHEQLKLALQGGNLGAWVWDIPTGHEVYNEILPKLLEYKLDEIIPNIKWWEDNIHPNDLEQVNIDLQDHFDGKTDFFINEHRLKTKNGDWRWFLDHGQVMERDNDGKPIRMIGTLRDITKRKQAVEELEDLKNNLEKQVAKKTEEMRGQIEKSERSRKAMLYMVEDLNRTSRELQSTQDQLVRSERLAAIGELAGGVAHELRNSLGVLTNAVSYLKLVVPMDNQTVKKNFDHMTDNVARANKVISNLLDLTRDIKAAKSVFPISTLIDAVLKDINISGRIKVEKRWPEEETYPVFADRDHLYHIIFNLLKNAGEAMTPPGGKPAEGKLMLRCRRDDNGKVIFSISDTGGGILPEDKEKIFDPLFTKKSSGIGLGLSISRRYAELNGGSLTVESEVGVGSTFILTLPGGK